MGKYLVGIEQKTAGCKACIFDLKGTLVASCARGYGSIYPRKGYVEQREQDITPALYASCAGAIENSGIDPREIIGVGLSSQGAVIALADKDGNPLHNFINWQDSRGTEMRPFLTSYMEDWEFYEITGKSLLDPFVSISQHVWLQRNMPELYARADLFLTQQEFFLRKLGADGWFSDSSSVCRETIADVDNHTYSARVFDAFNMDLGKRGQVVDNGTIVGRVTPEISELTKLPAGTPICVGALGQDCSAFGLGLIREGDTGIVMDSFGACYIVSESRIRSYPLTVKSHTWFQGGPNTFTIEAGIRAAAGSYRWLGEILDAADPERRPLALPQASEKLEHYLSHSPPGANGVTFLPYLQGKAGGAANANASGAIVGLRTFTKREDLVRACIEGVTYEMREIMNDEEAAGVDMKDLRLSGFATNIPLWCQMQADIYRKPVSIVQTSENSCLGAAMFAGVGTGAYRDAYEAVKQAVHVVRTYEPNPDLAEIYCEAFEKFDNFYQGLQTTLFK